MSSSATHLTTLPDGRALAFDEHGDPEGTVVVFFHASPGSRRFDPDPEATVAAGVRLLIPDRPGYGESSPLAGDVVPTVAGLADDLVTGIRALGVDECAIAGWSAGGRLALAAAARHPELVRSLAVIATPAPDDEVPWVPPHYRELAVEMRKDPSGARATVEAAFATTVGVGETAVGAVSGGAADDAALEDPSLRQRITEMLVEAFRTSASGVAVDIVADQVLPWGFDPAAVGAATTLYYGDADPICGPDHGRWWAKQVPDAELQVVPDAGHLVVTRVWADVLAAG